MRLDDRCDCRAAAGEAGAASIPEREAGAETAHLPAAQDESGRRLGHATFCRAGCAGRGTAFARATGHSTLARFRPETESRGALMLHLSASTDAAWPARARGHLDELLADHAHCEKKAASTPLSMLFRSPEQTALLAPLARLAREELAHFEEVLEQLKARGLELRRQRPSPYAAELLAGMRTAEPGRLAAPMLCLPLIEAPDGERLEL